MGRRMCVMTPTYDGYWEGTKECCRKMVRDLPQVQFVFLRVS